MHIGEFSFEIAKVKSKCDFYSEGTALLVYKTYFSKKKESPNSKSEKWTPLTLNDENLVLINRNFSAIGQLNEPFITIVINDDTSD